jgi:hypothetical protein
MVFYNNIFRRIKGKTCNAGQVAMCDVANLIEDSCPENF